MVGKCVTLYANVPIVIANSTDTQEHDMTTVYSPIEIATLVCFIVGVIQVQREILI